MFAKKKLMNLTFGGLEFIFKIYNFIKNTK